eukprot:TRINITY_DN1550_c0_g1_i1.p1 TRINITY_DN1550_c0_g1~~TRINITY_DN1550_c0_g1_i1.p1  ORF type:complete len:128 (-),score=47.61 TRINITY_DN1550_c0_g1_i1:112-495(-)
MELFIKYQIPADLLAFQQPGDCEVAERDPRRVRAVEAHVASMYEMINAEKQREEQEKRKEMEYRRARERAEEDRKLQKKKLSRKMESRMVERCAMAAPPRAMAAPPGCANSKAVSYTHLTLPTIYSV